MGPVACGMIISVTTGTFKERLVECLAFFAALTARRHQTWSSQVALHKAYDAARHISVTTGYKEVSFQMASKIKGQKVSQVFSVYFGHHAA